MRDEWNRYPTILSQSQEDLEELEDGQRIA